jgi:peptidoglycan hydrolase-like protein with peptidoglycan-binding domain
MAVPMALQSKLFSGDAKLEAAAVSDPAHILPGSTGPHVAKIQRALILLDDAKNSEDSVYGPATAAAVLAYKQKRNIINRSYQTKADNIVGKMTIASLDGEMLATEVVPAGPPRLTPIFPMQRPSPSRPLPQSASHLLLGFNTPPLDALPTIPPPSLTLTPSTLEVKPNEIGLIRVDNGRGKELVCVNPSIATIAPLDLPPNAHTLTRVKITQDPQFFRVFAKGSPGRTSITVSPSSLFFDPFMTVIVLAEVKVFFHFLGGPAGIATTRKRSDLAAIVQTMNNIYQREHSGFVFTNVGFNPSLAVAG